MRTRQRDQQIPLLAVLMAIVRTQGRRASDFAFVGQGELVTLVSVCDSERGNPYDGCGCTSAFVGVRGRQATTTAVVEMAMTRNDYLRRLRDSTRQTRFLRPGEDLTDVGEQAEELLDIAVGWPIGTVVERRGDLLQVRQWPPEPHT